MSADKSSEILDIFDESMNPMGTATRSEAHAKGLWHQTFQCWIWDNAEGEGALLFQERHPDKDTFPGLLDISCAGHLIAGERAEDGVRELEEELGLRVPFEELIPCGIFPEEDRISPELIDREFCHVFLYPCRHPLTEYRLQEEEVTGLYRLSIADVRRLAQGTDFSLNIQGISADPKRDGSMQSVERTVVAEDFVPHPELYYKLLLQTIENYQQEISPGSGK
ncbi:MULTISPECIES: NUDIX domain-containing protein [unclassified Paenibacillus]|uniref:NUDIX hydrolase n=1 Tax=unclassified Paenibacillus TaxID=185978 RepID=UPI001AE84DD9|nr:MULTISPECIES: NUDIX domain-containing protein [unclassified Paenibacillus]MBP1155681.1 isopentenyldiphosphate isomerase [Paenibacillus sp. PvP091]MBP1168933.1 isopentenyldiphosphate isomerase [Paenibacillus sp. PvR098]MBP2439961.1 isopentenyldiphosphate isomerase [Paenibacillus sp. PvP052]